MYESGILIPGKSETLDHNGNIRQVRPDPNTTGGIKVHYMFDKDGNYMGSWSPK